MTARILEWTVDDWDPGLMSDRPEIIHHYRLCHLTHPFYELARVSLQTDPRLIVGNHRRVDARRSQMHVCQAASCGSAIPALGLHAGQVWRYPAYSSKCASARSAKRPGRWPSSRPEMAPGTTRESAGRAEPLQGRPPTAPGAAHATHRTHVHTVRPDQANRAIRPHCCDHVWFLWPMPYVSKPARA